MFRARSLFLCLTLGALVFVVTGGLPAPSAANGQGSIYGPHVSGEILIQFAPGARGLDRASARANVNATRLRTFRSGAEHWRLGPGMTVDKAIDQLSRNPNVRYAEPNYLVEADVVPNDTLFDDLWGMLNTGQTGGTPDADIDADMAWGVTTGSHDIVVGVIDTGVDYNHPDLAANIWTNPGEIAGNGIDDDNNGYVDDVHGYDFYNNDGDPFDDNGHGTHVSGTIGGVGNNGLGVAGVNWNVSIMGLKFLSAGGSGSTAAAVEAVDYSVMMGVHLTSNSWGGGGASQTLYDAINAAGAQEMLFVAAAGNSNSNTDVSPHYPSAYDLNNIIAVAASDHNDNKASFSSYGLNSVDLAAPGVDILSTLPGNSYGLLSGTSMATPHVAGVVALLKSRFPSAPAAQVKTAIMLAADPIAAFDPAGPTPVATGGRLNAFFSIADPDQDPPDAIGDLATTNPGSNTMGLTWTATGDDGNVGTATFYRVRYSTSPIDENNWAGATLAGNAPNPQPSGSMESMEVGGLDYSTTYYFAVKAHDEWGNPSPISNLATGTTLPAPTVGYAPATINEALFTGEQAMHVVTLRNDGVGTLDFTIPTPALSEPLAVYPPMFLDKSEVDPRPGILGSGGPDMAGYRWKDSDDPGGPAFDWVDISAIGTPIASLDGDDENSGAIPIGFSFPFYGTLFDEIRVSTNGWLSFTSSATSYSNQPLPNSGAPENLLAAFWDDLHFRGTNKAAYHNDGSRFIVQFTGVDRYTTGSDLTFQVILYPSGRIVYQYLSLSGVLDSATIGIQNAAKNDGLTVAFETAYLHDNLAVAFTVIPQWLTVSPTSGRIPAGGSIPLDVDIDASGLEGGTYPGQINIENNDPVQPVVSVDVTLVVTGAPDAEVAPASLGFGDRFLGLPDTLTLSVLNNGTDTLHVSGIATSHPGELEASPGAFDVAPHASQEVTVTWTPVALGPFSGSLTVSSDDTGEPSIVVPVTGNAIPAPIMITTPSSFSDTLYSGQTSTHTLTVINAGGSDLIVDTAADQGNGGTGLVVGNGLGTAGSGGPDAFDYRWRDSDESGGPVFDWVDISSSGTVVPFTSSDDQYRGPFDLGMTFPFYGTNYSQVWVSTNGWLSFVAPTSSDYSNDPLPSSIGPRALVAPFWDDLHKRSGDATYLYDGQRFIMQFTDWGRISPSTGVDFTFQVLLYPNGKIVYQYLTMSGAILNSSTIGIQNEARDIGLEVAYNTAYIHDQMAIQISRQPDWLTVTPSQAVIPPGDSFPFDVTFDATDRNGGVLNGNVVLNTNIPTQSQVLLPATLTVIGAPEAVMYPASQDYGTVYTGYPHLTQIMVVNNGTAVLNVDDVVSNDPYLFVEAPPAGNAVPEAAFPLAPGQSRLFSLRWSPMAPYVMNAEVQVLSDDPVNPVLVLPVTGVAIDPPIAAWSPSSFTESLDVGDIVHRTLHLENNGASDLEFGSSVRVLGGTPVTVYPELELKKEEPDPRPGILGTGGPDTYGYTWIDSDEPGGPVFDWVDISAVGTQISFGSSSDCDDCNSGAIPIGFTFPFYGDGFDEVRVVTNGWLSFTSSLTAYSNQPLPNSGSGVPENLLAVFWDDLVHRDGVGSEPIPSAVYYYNDGTRFIVQYQHMYRIAEYSDDLNFQVILYPSGRVVYQYETMSSSTLNSATIGQQNAAKDDGLTVVYNSDYVHENMAIALRSPLEFLQLDPPSGIIPPMGSMDLDVTIDTTNLIGGDHFASLDINTNDPAHAIIGVPVTLHITGIPDISADPASLMFPTTFIGFGSTLPMAIQNVGTDVLHITGATISGDFTAPGLTAPVDLPVGGTIPLDVTFSPTVDGLRAGEITIVSDDPDTPMFTVPLEGYGLIPPEIGVTPSSISTALPPGGTRTKTLTIYNNGGSDLTWDAGTNLISTLGSPVPVYTELELARDEVDPRPGILGAGGPDMFGYSWSDSDEPGGPVFDWVDISSVGTLIEFNSSGYCLDCNAGPFPIGFNFPFYGNSFGQLYVTTEGWVSFTSTSSAYSNQPLPNSGSSVPENLIASFWDDLVLRSGTGSEPVPSHAYYYNDGSRFIVQWDNFYQFIDYDTNFTFQVILYPSGKIVHQYLTMANGSLDSATIGQQNATKDDGLTIVHNADYMHDGLAIQVQAGPEWMTVSPTSGTIPAGGSQDVTVALRAVGLDMGIHQAAINLASNDPYTPVLTVPVTLNVSLLEPAYLNFDPDVLNLSSSGSTVKVVIELPVGYDPHMINLASISLNDSVPALPSPIEYTDENHNGIEELVVRFDRDAVEAVLAEGTTVPVTIQLEVTDIQWFRGTTSIRAMRPQVMHPNGAEYLYDGQILTIDWAPPQGVTGITYNVYLSLDGGGSWQELATGLTGTSFDWMVNGTPTASARVRVVALDSAGVVGYDGSDGDFLIATAMTPPGAIGDSLVMEVDAGDIVLSWRRPAVDLTHGPADHYRVLISTSAQGPFTELGVTSSELYRDPIGNHAGTTVIFYQVVAGNVAGESTN